MPNDSSKICNTIYNQRELNSLVLSDIIYIYQLRTNSSMRKKKLLTISSISKLLHTCLGSKSEHILYIVAEMYFSSM